MMRVSSAWLKRAAKVTGYTTFIDKSAIPREVRVWNETEYHVFKGSKGNRLAIDFIHEQLDKQIKMDQEG